MIDVAGWCARWEAARTDTKLQSEVKALVRELKPCINDAGGELRLARLALFGSGRIQWFKGIADDRHPLAHVQEAVNLAQLGQHKQAARVLARALRRLQTADDDGQP